MSNNQGKIRRLDNGFAAPKSLGQLLGNDVTKGFAAPKPFDLTQGQIQGTATTTSTTNTTQQPTGTSQSSGSAGSQTP